MSRLESGTSDARSRAMRAASAGSDARTGVSVIRALRNARAYGTSAALIMEIELTPTRRDSGALRSRAALQPLVEACLLSTRTHSVPSHPPVNLALRHRTSCARPTVSRSGSIRRHLSVANLQRGANEKPGGRL